MKNIHRTFADNIKSQWIKIKFFREKPDLESAKRLQGVRFCEATREAILHPVILDKESINCPGAQYAFGWKNQSLLLEHCREKTELSEEIIQSMLPQMPRFQDSFEYIGLNMEGEPDLIMARLMPEDVMDLINLYHSKTGHHLDVSLSSMMSVCGGIAVKTLLENRITFSFGCVDSRKYAKISRDRLVVGVPRVHFDLIKFNHV
ncbi:DUF169 domain-containing protein [bacterium]|nr:DUF169 domain-containing protein [bacterium]